MTAFTQSSNSKSIPDGMIALAPDDPPLLALTTYEAAAAGECRWPIESEGHDLCCGREALRDNHTGAASPYCVLHHRRAYHKALNISDAGHEKLHNHGLQIMKRRADKGGILAALHTAEDLGL